MDKISIAQRKCRCNPAGALSGLRGGEESPAGKFTVFFGETGQLCRETVRPFWEAGLKAGPKKAAANHLKPGPL